MIIITDRNIDSNNFTIHIIIIFSMNTTTSSSNIIMIEMMIDMNISIIFNTT
jgi:hypothetical protein